MIPLAFLALALGGVAVAALLRSLTLSRSQVAAHLDDLGACGYTAAAPALPAEVATPRGSALAARLGDRAARRVGAGREAELRRLLMTAGMYSTSARTVL